LVVIGTTITTFGTLPSLSRRHRGSASVEFTP
jgi:hypothetical protein